MGGDLARYPDASRLVIGPGPLRAAAYLAVRMVVGELLSAFSRCVLTADAVLAEQAALTEQRLQRVEPCGVVGGGVGLAAG
jgi:hypothetical protein